MPAALSERQQALDDLCRREGVGILYVFGSRADEVREWLAGTRETLARGPSDVDIGTLLPRELPRGVSEYKEIAVRSAMRRC